MLGSVATGSDENNGDIGSAAVVVEQARERLESGDADGALALLRPQIAASPTDGEARAMRVRALLQLDRWEEALSAARGDQARLPDSAAVASALGSASLRAGEIEDADRILSPLARFPDADPLGLVALGRVRNAQGRGREARTLLDRAYARGRDDPAIVYWCAGAGGTREEIIARLHRFLELGGGGNDDLIEAVRGKIDLYKALGDREIWVPVERPDRVELSLTPLGDGSGGIAAYLVDADMGGRSPVPLMFDTGSTDLFMVKRIARKRGFEELAIETAFGGAGDKRHRSARGLVPTVSIGGVRYADALATTIRHDLERTGRFQGVIGLSFWDGYHALIDLNEERLVFDRTLPATEDGIPYWVVAGQMLVQVETSTGHRGLFLFDTGATRSTLSLGFAERIPTARVGEKVTVWGYGGRFPETRVITGVGLIFQNRASESDRLNGVDLSLQSRISGVEISGLLGLDMLADRTIVVDTRTQRISMREPPHRKRSKKKK